MTTDPVRRAAARTATLIAAPVALVVALVSVWAFGGFDADTESPQPTPTGPVSVEIAALSPDAAAICREVVAHLPETVGSAKRRPVTAGAEQAAAYGEPPITLSCGTAPTSYPSTATLYHLGEVCWYAEQGSPGTVWTTVDRSVPVTVVVPGEADGSGQFVQPFSPAIAAADPVADPVPTGC